jgi:hypothetical protein
MAKPIKICGRGGDRVELMLGDNVSFISTTDAGVNSKRQLAMMTDRGLMKIATVLALHLGYRLEPIERKT